MMNNRIYVGFDEVTASLNELTTEYQKLEETYEQIKACFNRLRDANLEGEAAEEMLGICDDWDAINADRLERIGLFKDTLSEAYTIYKTAQETIESTVV